MSTAATYFNPTRKRLIGTEDLSTRLMDYMRTLVQESMERSFRTGVVYDTALGLSAGGTDRVNVTGASVATDGQGHILDVAANGYSTGLYFENSLGVVYEVGLKYASIPDGVQINPRTGLPEFIGFKEAIGIEADPDLVTDNGANITLRVDGVTEAGVSNAGRQVMVFKNAPGKNAITEALAVEILTVSYTGGFNVVTSSGLFGQDVGSVSVDATEYTAVLMGPHITRNTVIYGTDGYTFIGEVTGVGAGGSPAVFVTTNQDVLDVSLSDLQDITSRNVSTDRLKVDVKSYAGDVNDPQIQVRDPSGVAKFIVDGNGNVTISGTTTQQDVVQVNSSETITDNLTAGDDDALDSHLIKGTWRHTDTAGSANHFYVDGASGRVGIGQVQDASYALAITGADALKVNGRFWVESTAPNINYRESDVLATAGGLWRTRVSSGDWELQESTAGEWGSAKSWISTVRGASRVDINATLAPSSNNVNDLGRSGTEWRDLYITRTAFIDELSLGVAAGEGLGSDMRPDSDITRSIGTTSLRIDETHSRRFLGGSTTALQTPTGDIYSADFSTYTSSAPGTGNIISGSNHVARSNHTSGTKTHVRGLSSIGESNGLGGSITTLQGGFFQTNILAVGAAVTTRVGVDIEEGSTIASPATAYGIRIGAATGSAGADKYGLSIGDVSGASGTNYSIKTGLGSFWFGGDVVRPIVNNGGDMGTSSFRWNNIYVTNLDAISLSFTGDFIPSVDNTADLGNITGPKRWAEGWFGQAVTVATNAGASLPATQDYGLMIYNDATMSAGGLTKYGANLLTETTTFGAAQTSTVGVASIVENKNTTGVLGFVAGLSGIARGLGSAGGSTELVGVRGAIELTTNHAAGSAFHLWASAPSVSGAGTSATTWAGLQIDGIVDANVTGGATVGTAYGINIGDVNVTASTNYAIKTGLGLVDFGGDLTVTGKITSAPSMLVTDGSATPAATAEGLHIIDSGSPEIWFEDTGLSAATDGRLWEIQNSGGVLYFRVGQANEASMFNAMSISAANKVSISSGVTSNVALDIPSGSIHFADANPQVHSVMHSGVSGAATPVTGNFFNFFPRFSSTVINSLGVYRFDCDITQASGTDITQMQLLYGANNSSGSGLTGRALHTGFYVNGLGAAGKYSRLSAIDVSIGGLLAGGATTGHGVRFLQSSGVIGVIGTFYAIDVPSMTIATTLVGMRTAGRIEPATTAVTDVGTSSKRWRTVYAGGGTAHAIDTSGASAGIKFDGWSHVQYVKTTGQVATGSWAPVIWNTSEYSGGSASTSGTQALTCTDAGYYWVSYSLPVAAYGTSNDTLMARITVNGVVQNRGQSKCGIHSAVGKNSVQGQALILISASDLIRVEIVERSSTDTAPVIGSTVCGTTFNGTSDLTKGVGTFTMEQVRLM